MRLSRIYYNCKSFHLTKLLIHHFTLPFRHKWLVQAMNPAYFVENKSKYATPGQHYHTRHRRYNCDYFWSIRLCYDQRRSPASPLRAHLPWANGDSHPHRLKWCFVFSGSTVSNGSNRAKLLLFVLGLSRTQNQKPRISIH